MNFNEFEEVISKIDGILNVKIVPEGEDIREIHIVSNRLRSPKQIVRDIESTVYTVFNYRIDRKVISIAQLETDELKKFRRMLFNGVSLSTIGNCLECSVSVEFEGETYTATESTIKTTSNKRKIIALSLIKAVEKIINKPNTFDVLDVSVYTAKNISYVNVLVMVIVDNREEVLIGSSLVQDDINEAIAKAALDSLNRRIDKICM